MRFPTRTKKALAEVGNAALLLQNLVDKGWLSDPEITRLVLAQSNELRLARIALGREAR